MQGVAARVQVAELGMVDAGHRAPGLVYSLQIVLVHRILDVRIIEVGEVDVERILVVWQADFPCIVQRLGQELLVFCFVYRDAVDGEVGDDCLHLSWWHADGAGWLDEDHAVGYSEYQSAIFQPGGAVLRKVVAEDGASYLERADIVGLGVETGDSFLCTNPDIAVVVFLQRAGIVVGESLAGIKQLVLQVPGLLVVAAFQNASGCCKPQFAVVCLDAAIDFAYGQLSVFVAEAEELLGCNLPLSGIHHGDTVVAAYPESALAVQDQVVDLCFLSVSIQKLFELPWLQPCSLWGDEQTFSPGGYPGSSLPVEDGLVEGCARSIMFLLMFGISHIVNVDAVALGRYPFPALRVDGIIVDAGIGLPFQRSLLGPGIIDISPVGTGADGEFVIAYVADVSHVVAPFPVGIWFNLDMLCVEILQFTAAIYAISGTDPDASAAVDEYVQQEVGMEERVLVCCREVLEFVFLRVVDEESVAIRYDVYISVGVFGSHEVLVSTVDVSLVVQQMEFPEEVSLLAEQVGVSLLVVKKLIGFEKGFRHGIRYLDGWLVEDAGLQVHGESFFLGKDIPFSLTEEGGARFPHISHHGWKMGFPDGLARVVIKEGIALVGQHGDMIAVCGQGDDVLVLEHQMALAVWGDAVESFIGCYPDIVFEIFLHL